MAGPCQKKWRTEAVRHFKIEILCEREVDRGFAAITAGFDVESDLLVIFQASQAGTLYSGDVDENVLGSTFRSDKAEAFSCVNHFTVPLAIVLFLFDAAREIAAARLSQNLIE